MTIMAQRLDTYRRAVDFGDDDLSSLREARIRPSPESVQSIGGINRRKHRGGELTFDSQ